jgi:hypothetical protein
VAKGYVRTFFPPKKSEILCGNIEIIDWTYPGRIDRLQFPTPVRCSPSSASRTRSLVPPLQLTSVSCGDIYEYRPLTIAAKLESIQLTEELYTYEQKVDSIA